MKEAYQGPLKEFCRSSRIPKNQRSRPSIYISLKRDDANKGKQQDSWRCKRQICHTAADIYEKYEELCDDRIFATEVYFKNHLH